MFDRGLWEKNSPFYLFNIVSFKHLLTFLKKQTNFYYNVLLCDSVILLILFSRRLIVLFVVTKIYYCNSLPWKLELYCPVRLSPHFENQFYFWGSHTCFQDIRHNQGCHQKIIEWQKVAGSEMGTLFGVKGLLNMKWMKPENRKKHEKVWSVLLSYQICYSWLVKNFCFNAGNVETWKENKI